MRFTALARRPDGTEGPTIGPDGILEFPPETITPDGSGAGAAGGAGGGFFG